MHTSTRTSMALALGLWGLALLLAIRFAIFAVSVTAQPTHGFAAYYTAARLVKDNADISRFYDDDWFQAQIPHYGPAVKDIYNVNPPTMALLFLPLAGLDYADARTIWMLFTLACLAGAIGWLLWQGNLHGLSVPAFIAFILLYQPLHSNVSQGQVYVLLLGLLTIVWYSYRHEWPRMLGLALGLMLVLKTAGILLWLLLLIQRRWHALAWGLASVLAISLGSLAWLGPQAWQTYFSLLPDLNSKPELAVTAYQTQLSLIRHLLTFDPRWNPAPLLQAPILGMWLPWLGFAAIVGVSAYGAYTVDQADMVFAAFVAANVILSPVALDYHYLFILVPVTILVTWARGQAAPWPGVVLGVAMVLVAIDLPYWSPRLAAGARAFLAYPKLYGAYLLWGMALWAARQKAVPACASSQYVG